MPQHAELRIFISSTFHDLQAEREYLVKKVFPEIRQLCRKHGVEFTEIDLRWGLTEEEAAHGKIIRTCLEEIDRCRPYFIGIIANRYGWSPQFHDIQKDSELINHYPWIEDAITDERSIIDIEFQYGGLQYPSEATGAYFYIKADDAPHTYTPTQSEKKKVDRIKEQVRASTLPVKTFSSPDELGQFVREDLIRQIQLRWGSSDEQTPLETERAAHQAFAITRRKAYIINPAYLNRFTDFIEKESDGKPLVIFGDSGIGKSSLVAYLAHTYARRNKDAFTIEHYVGATTDAADHISVIRHIISEIRERFAPDDELPSTSDLIVSEFQTWLSKIPTKAVIFIDAVNQLEGIATNMAWLPSYIPTNIRLIISTTNEDPLKHLREAGCAELEIQPLSSQEREAIIVRFLGEYHKALSPSQCRLIAANERSASPLFLRTILEELRLFNVFDDIDTAISEYLEANDLEDLFQIVLARMERDHGHVLVKELLSLIWIARRGLSETELLDLFNQMVKSKDDQLTRLEFSQFISALDYHLIRKDGLLNFFHQYLRSAVEDRYFKKQMHKSSLHRRLGAYFRSQPISNRRTDEEPFHWQRGEAWEEFNECLTNIPMLETMLGEDRIYELIGYWLVLREHFDDVAEYRKAIHKFEKETTDERRIAEVYAKLGKAFFVAGTYKPAEHFLRRATELRESLFGTEHTEVAESYNELGKLLIATGDYDEAETLCRKANEIYLKEYGEMNAKTAESIVNLATLLYSRGKYDESEVLFRQALRIREELFGMKHRETIKTLSDLGSVIIAKGILEEAGKILEEVVKLTIADYGENHTETANRINNLASVYKSQGKLDESIRSFQKSYNINKNILGPKHIETITNLINIGVLQQDMNLWDDSEKSFKDCISILKKELGEKHPLCIVTSVNLAKSLYIQKKYSDAEVIYLWLLSLENDSKLLDRNVIAVVAKNLGLLYSETGLKVKAKEILTLALKIKTDISGKDNPQTRQYALNLYQNLDDDQVAEKKKIQEEFFLDLD